MSYVHPFSKRCDKSEIDLFSVPPTQQSLERGRWIDYAPLSSVENPDSAITYLIAGTDEYIDLSKTILTVRGEITKGDGTKLTGKKTMCKKECVRSKWQTVCFIGSYFCRHIHERSAFIEHDGSQGGVKPFKP